MNDQTSQSQQTTACARCKHANPTGARFCAGCGMSIGQSAPPPPPPPPPPDYNMNFNSGGGTGTTAQSPLDPASAVTAIQQAIVAQGGSITQTNANGGTFVLGHGKWYLTMWMKVKMDGRFSVTGDGKGGSAISVTLGSSMNALIPILAINAVCGLLLGPMILLVVAIDAYIWWYYTSQAPRENELAIMGKLQTVRPEQTRPQQPGPDQSFRQAEAAQKVYPQDPPADAPRNPTEDPYEQLRKLAGLREAGAITPEEFEAKKAEILTRI